MKVAVVRESFPAERRVALMPANIPHLQKMDLEVTVQSGAGSAAGFADAQYQEKGATIVQDLDELFSADIILQVRGGGANPAEGKADLARLREGQIVIGMCDPLGEPEALLPLAATGATQFSLELIPRITRAQSMDVLSSMATIAGYRAVLLASVELPKMFPMLMTAAGTLTAARVFIIGAGVAGLQAIATARRLGGVASAYDVRPAVREQVESLGAKFVEMDLATDDAEGKGGYAKAQDETFYQRQRELMASVVAESDVVITTAAIPGKPSPLLITADAVAGMRAGSVIVDLAAERGGNCELSQPDQRVEEHGVIILGPTNLPSEIPTHASQMYSNNVTKFLGNLIKDGKPHLDLEDEIIDETLVVHEGQVVNNRLREILKLEPLFAEIDTGDTDVEDAENGAEADAIASNDSGTLKLDEPITDEPVEAASDPGQKEADDSVPDSLAAELDNITSPTPEAPAEELAAKELTNDQAPLDPTSDDDRAAGTASADASAADTQPLDKPAADSSESGEPQADIPPGDVPPKTD